MTVRARTALVVALAVAVAMLVVLAGGAGARAGFTVRVGDNFFAPTQATVAKGTKVRFKWVGEDEHQVVKKRGPGRDFGSSLTDERGVNLKRKLRKRGTYRMICTVHDEMRVKLEVD